MSQLLETIKCKNGKLFNISFHNSRFNKSRNEYFKTSGKINLEDIIEIPENFKNGLFSCRILYSETIDKIEFLPHQIREIRSLKLVRNDVIDYHFKYFNRKKLDELFEQRAKYDDILIVKNNCITDSYTANSVFFDGLKWWTPDTPLLPGTQRARLINEGKILECRITPKDLSKYEKVGLINAMQDLEEMPVMLVEKIYL